MSASSRSRATLLSPLWTSTTRPTRGKSIDQPHCDQLLPADETCRDRNHIQQRGFYSIVQNLLAIHLKPALVSGTVPRIDEVVDSQDSPKVAAPKEAAPQASVSKGSAFKGSASKGSASKASAPKTRVSAPKPAVPAADDADLQTGAWTDDEVKLMIRMRVNGASHPRVAVSSIHLPRPQTLLSASRLTSNASQTTLNRALKGCQLQWGRRMREQHWREFAQGCGATSQQEVEGEDEKEDEEEDEDKEDEEEGSEELEA